MYEPVDFFKIDADSVMEQYPPTFEARVTIPHEIFASRDDLDPSSLQRHQSLFGTTELRWRLPSMFGFEVDSYELSSKSEG
jgi:hypothetical protein